MNPVAVALERAVATAADRAQLADAFAREWAALEFAPGSCAVVLGVGAAQARAWAADQITDLALILSARTPPEAIFWAGLPRLDAYRAGLVAARDLWRRGAALMVLNTAHPVVLRHALRLGFTVATQHDDECRMIGEGEAVRKLLNA